MKQSLQDVEVVLLDIEGTICPITFVKDTLFPYALNALPEVLRKSWHDQEFVRYKDAFPEPAQSSPETFLAHVQDLTRRDVKVAYLKNLQGYLWQSGYEKSAYATPLFDDVVPALQSIKKSKKRIAIYSSGSIFAQKLLFAHVQSPTGSSVKETIDLTSLIEDQNYSGESWFDTTNAGLKHDVKSYELIAETLQRKPSTILFLSDNVKEVAAALDASMKSIVVERPGNAPLSSSDREKFDVITSFDELHLP